MTFLEDRMNAWTRVAGLAALSAAVGLAGGGRAGAGSPALTIDGRIGVSAAIALADGHIRSVVHGLQLLATTDEVRSGTWDKMLPLLTRFKDTQIPAVVFFALPDGSYYTVPKGKTAHTIKDRAYFSKVMAGERTLGDLVVSRSTGRKVMVATVPIEDRGTIVGALGGAIHLDELSQRLARELQLPPGMVVYAIDVRRGITALHSETGSIFDDPRTRQGDSLRRAVQEMMSREEGTVTYEHGGTRTTAHFRTSPLTGWRFAVAVTSE